MIQIENVEIFGWEAAIRGMRNPKNSWDRSDSIFTFSNFNVNYIGANDLDLMRRLSAYGPVHAKYRRMIIVTCDIVAPLYWWKEFDTYKVGTVENSCSTMHKIHSKEFDLDDFSHEHLCDDAIELFEEIIEKLNDARMYYNGWDEFSEIDKEHFTRKDIWWQMIQLLPSSYNQRRTVQLNYEVLSAMYECRKNHKLDEWRDFCKWIEKLPYSEIMGVT